MQEVVSNLHALMLRFNCVEEIRMHELGQSLMLMVASEGGGIGRMGSRRHFEISIDPFMELR